MEKKLQTIIDYLSSYECSEMTFLQFSDIMLYAHVWHRRVTKVKISLRNSVWAIAVCLLKLCN